MKGNDNHEGLFSAAVCLFSESLKEENVFEFGVARGVFEIFSKLIEDEKQPRVTVAFGVGNGESNCLQYLFGIWPNSTTVHFQSERAQHSYAEWLIVSGCQYRSESCATNKTAEIFWKLAFGAFRDPSQR